MKKKLGFLLTPLIAAFCLLSACSNTGSVPSAPAAPSAAAQTPSQTPVTPTQAPAQMELVVGQMGTSVKPALVILANELGYFKEENLTVKLEPISNLNDAATALMEGKLDVLPYGMIPTCTFVAQGADLVVIGGTITGGSTCVALPDRAAEFETLEGFRGKTVACMRPETGHMYMMALLREAGLELGTDVTFVEMDSFQSVTEAVLKGAADVGFVNSFTQTAVKQGLTPVFDVADLSPDLVCCRQTTSAAVIAEKREALLRFETALLRAYHVFKTDPDTTVSLLSAFSGQDEEYTRTFLYEDALIVSPDPAVDRVVEFYGIMQENGDIDAGTTYDMADHVDASIYREALDTLKSREPDEPLWDELIQAFARNNPV